MAVLISRTSLFWRRGAVRRGHDLAAPWHDWIRRYPGVTSARAPDNPRRSDRVLIACVSLSRRREIVGVVPVPQRQDARLRRGFSVVQSPERVSPCRSRAPTRSSARRRRRVLRTAYIARRLFY